MVKVPPRRGACASAMDGAASAAAAPAPQSFRRSRRARTEWVGMGSGSSGSDPCASPSALILPEGSPASQRRTCILRCRIPGTPRPLTRTLTALGAAPPPEADRHEAHHEELERRRLWHRLEEAFRPRGLNLRRGMDIVPEEELVELDLVRHRINAVGVGGEVALEARIGRVGDAETRRVGGDIPREIEEVELVDRDRGIEHDYGGERLREQGVEEDRGLRGELRLGGEALLGELEDGPDIAGVRHQDGAGTLVD